MQVAKTIEQLARECFARLCPWIAKEYPEFPIEKSTTMQAFLEGAATNKCYLGLRTYHYDKGVPRTFWFVTLNGRQIGSVCFSLQEALDSIELIKSGGDKW
jgi:hypothetical protein